MAKRATPALVLVLLAGLPASSQAAESDAAATKRSRLAKQVRLETFGSCAGLIRYGRRHAGKGPGGAPIPGVRAPEPLFAPLLPPSAPVPGAPPSPLSPDSRSVESAPGESGTNVQEAGVDEPDLVKAGGGRIFVVAAGRLHAVGVDGLKLLGTLHLRNGSDHQLLLHGDRLLLISHTSPLGSGEPADASQLDIAPPDTGDTVTELTEVDVSDPSAMRVLRTERIRGHHVSSRLTGRTARVVIWTRPRAVLEPRFRTQLRGWLPRRVLRKPAARRARFRLAAPCRRVSRPASYSGIDVLTVLTIDMEKGLPAVDSDAVMGGGQTVYASTSSLYVGTPEWASEAAAEPGAGEHATLHRFDATDPDSTTYRASGRVAGRVLNQFALSEHDGVLRVASTVNPDWAPRADSESRVTTLAERGGILAKLGEVGGLGKGERIYAVRMIGEVGYVVTFRQVDPLYTLDLSRPSEPRVAGELKVRGYSAYLHPVAEGLLLGVGQDASERGVQLGTQVSLFDVSDPARPQRLHQRTLGNTASSEAEWDHHAFLWWGPAKLAVLPITSWSGDDYAGAVGLNVDRAAGIAEAGRATHGDRRYAAEVRRSLVVAGKLVTISEAGIEQNRMSDLAEQAWLPFPPAG